MDIEKITPQGFCFGVKRALDIAKTSKLKYETLYIYNDIINNRIVTKELLDNNIITEYDKELIKENVIISAHGLSDNEIQYFKDKNINVIDSTCPLVKNVHNLIKKYILKDFEIFYIGKNNHPESNAIVRNFNVHLISKIEDIPLNITKKIMVSNQTTLSIIDIKDIYDKISKLYPSALIINNICNATKERQEAIINLEKKDLILVVGDIKSSNSNRLVEIGRKYHKNAYLINTYKDIKEEYLINVEKIGVTAGASTPDFLVDEVISFLKKL